jgi:hypothetical protein
VLREDIVFDDGDRNSFVETLGEAATRANWQVHAFCLMRKDDPEVGKLLSRGWRFGAEDFLDRLEERMMGALSDNHDPEQVAEMMQVRLARLLAQELQRCKVSAEKLGELSKGHPLKIRLAEKLHRETPMTLRWIATALHMGSWQYVSHLLYLRRRKTKHTNKV